jgi:tetratricopeptide (TPR) repeat protein
MMWNRARIPLLLLIAVSLLLVSGCSHSYRAEILRAKSYAARDDYKNAVIHFQLALNRVPPQQQDLRSLIYFDIGDVLWRAGRQNQAFGYFEKAAETDPKNLDANLRLGQLLVSGGAISEAIPFIERAQLIDPTDARVLATMGAIEAAGGHETKARTYMIASLNADPSNTGVAIALAEMYNRANRVGEARQVLRDSAEHNPGSAAPWLALARLEEQEGKLKPAEEAYRSAVKAEDSVEANLRLSQFLQRTSRIQEAEELLKKVDGMQPARSTSWPDFQLITGRPLEAIRSYLRVLTADHLHGSKENAEAQSQLASRVVESQLQTALASSDPAMKQELIRQAKSLLEGFRQVLDPGTTAVLKVEVALAEDRLDEAQKFAESALEKAPDSAAAHYVKGVVLERAGKSAEAKVEWNAALQADEAHVPTRIALGSLLLSEGSLPAAEGLAAGSVRLEPANIRALQLYSRILYEESRLAPANAIANRALAIDSGSLEARMVLGDIALRRGDLRNALLEYQKAVVSNPQSAAALRGLVQVYRHGDVKPEMVRHIESIAKLPPASAPLMEIAGRLYAELGDYKEAIRALKQSLDLDDSRSSAVFALGQVYAQNGDPRSAEAVLAGLRASGIEKQRIGSLVAALEAEQRNESSKAIENYEEAVKLGEGTGIAANNLAWLYASQGKELDRALQLAKQASDIRPEDPAILDTLGVVHLKRRDYSAAIVELKHAAELAQARSNSTANRQLSSMIRMHLAEAYEGAGEEVPAAAGQDAAR